MLLEQRPGGGQVSVLTRNATFNRLLQAILAEWQFYQEADAASLDVLLLERGLAMPDGSHQVVWLSPMPLATDSYLEVPFSLTELYHFLEKLFFPQPRHHIRLALNQPIDLNVRGVWLVGRLLSLSDRGARVSCPATLPKGETLQLDFRLRDYPVRLTAEVLYDIPPGDAPGREHPQAGLLFKSLRAELRLALRHFIERNFIDQACEKTGISPSDPCLSWLALPRKPWDGFPD